VETAPVVPLRAFESSSAAGAAGGVLDDLLAQLADLVADRIATRLAGPRTSQKDEWLDTRRAAEYLGSTGTASADWLLSARSRRSRPVPVASSTSSGPISMPGVVMVLPR
jgi:hypothetical protein